MELSGQGWAASVSEAGHLQWLDAGERRIGFREDRWAGPAWYGEWESHTHEVALRWAGDGEFSGEADGLSFRLRYRAAGEALAVTATIDNRRGSPFRPVRAGLRLGVDSLMERYPDWNQQLFPTLLRCESSHFWGYFMSPEGAVLGIASPDPVASWSLNYNRASYGDYGHRIHTANLDLLQALPLPSRHPHIDELQAGEERSWTIFLQPLEGLGEVKPVLARLCEAPMLEIDRLTLLPGERATLTVYGEESVTLAGIPHVALGGGRYELLPGDAVRERRLVVTGKNGKAAEARLYVRPAWSWYLENARRESLRIPQKASTHVEGWLGLYTQTLARLHVPEAEADEAGEAKYREIVPQMMDLEAAAPRYCKTRVLNPAYMAGLHAARWRATGDPRELRIAGGLADYVLSFQAPNGSIYGDAGKGIHRVDYTSVAYPIKSVLEVCLAERAAGLEESAERHWRGVKGAMDALVRQRDNIETEGEITFEDGMIACSAAQLGFFALQQEDPEERRIYGEAALGFLKGHRCLQQLLIPDCRMHGCTLRFWESQYDVLLTPNMLNSPHGWSSWKSYATWYAYQLTGDEEWLRLTMNTLGACMQVLEAPSGRLRWGFVPDPYVRADQFGPRTHWSIDLKPERVFIEDPARPGCGEGAKRIIGEQYVEMISDVYEGWCCDNDVHEHFKCLEEVALTSAYVVERADGTIAAWNGRVAVEDGLVRVEPADEIVSAVHLNLRQPHRLRIGFGGGAREVDAGAGLQWVTCG